MSIEVNYNGLSRGRPLLRPENAVVYARYSSHKQGEQSIEGQLTAAYAYAEARGYTIVHEYIDRAMTGRNDDRAEFQQMLSDCSKKQFSVIIVWKVDRFGRNREEITFNKYRCKKHGVRVEYVAENMGEGPEAVILESVLEGMAEYYSLQLSQNIRRGNRENAKKCKFTGGRVPLGYRLDKEHNFVIDPDGAALVRRIYAMYAEGQTITEIITQLNAEGLHTSQDKPYTKNSLRTILKNEKYIGIYDFKDGEIRIVDGVPAIVDKDTYYKVQKLLSVNQRAPAARWSRADYLLTNKLFCGSCGSQMVGESGTSKTGAKHNYYLCISHKRGKSCARKAIRQDLIEPYILDKAQQLIMDDEVMDYIVENVWAFYQQQDQRRDTVTALQAQLAEVEKAITNLTRAIEAGMPLTVTTKNRLSELDAQQTALNSALAQNQLDGGFRLQKEHIQFFLAQFRELDYTDRKCQQRLIDVFINSIYVKDDKIVINFNFSGGNATLSFTDFKAADDAGVFGCRAFASTTRGSDEPCNDFLCRCGVCSGDAAAFEQAVKDRRPAVTGGALSSCLEVYSSRFFFSASSGSIRSSMWHSKTWATLYSW